jgi:hypothetical protein
MTATTAKSDITDVQRLLRAALALKVFEGFCFDTFFRLRFSGGDAPQAVELAIESEWWLGPKEDWPATVRRLAPPDAVQPDEPVKAYFLAHLRWTAGATITDVMVSPDALELVTQCGMRISIPSKSDGSDFAWRIEEPGVPEPQATWLVSCTGDGELYVRVAHPE